jgi:hypothetical protein
VVDFSLASQRLQAPSGGGIAPTLLTGGAAHTVAPQLNTNAANIKNSPMPVPNIIVDSTLAATATAAAQINQAAFNYSKREAAVVATNTSIAYNKFVRDTLNGYADEQGVQQDGYLASSGLGAGAQYPAMQQSLVDKRDEMLSGLNPMARQMAAIRLASTENTAIGAASNHRGNQLKKAEEEARYLEQQDIVANITSNPASIYTKDSLTGMTAKEAYYKDAVNIKATDKAWSGIIVETLDKIYRDGGLADAKEFNDKVAQSELKSSPSQLNRANESIVSWEQDNIREANAAITKARKEEERIEKIVWAKTEQDIQKRIFDGDFPDKQEFADMLAVNAIDPAYARVAQKEIYGEAIRERNDADYKKKKLEETYYSVVVSNILSGQGTATAAIKTFEEQGGSDILVTALQTPPEDRTTQQNLIIGSASVQGVVAQLINKQIPSDEALSSMVDNKLMDPNVALGLSSDKDKATAEAVEIVQGEVTKALASDMFNGKNPTPETLNYLQKNGWMTTQTAKNIQAEIETDERRLPEVSVLLEWESKVKDGTANRGYEGDENLTEPTRSLLRQMDAEMRNPKFAAEYKEISDNIDAWLKGAFWEAGIHDQEKEININTYNRDARARLKAGESKDSILNDLESKLNPVTQRLSNLFPLRSGVKPSTTEETVAQAKLLQQQFRSGQYTSEEYNAEKAHINDFFRTLKAAGL